MLVDNKGVNKVDDFERAARLAQDEIRALRRENEVLRARVETMDLMAALFMASPNRQGITMGEDPVWLLDKALREASLNNVAKEQG